MATIPALNAKLAVSDGVHLETGFFAARPREVPDVHHLPGNDYIKSMNWRASYRFNRGIVDMIALRENGP